MGSLRKSFKPSRHLEKMKSYALFLCLSQIVFCSSTPNRAKPDLTKEEFLENHEKFTGFLDNVHVITEAEDRSGESRPLEDVVNPSQGNCAHPKDLDCKLDSFSCLDPNHVDDPRCIPEVPNADPKTQETVESADEFADFEDVDTVPGDLDMAVKDVPEVPEPVEEKVEDMIENEEADTPRPAPEMVNASVPKRSTPTTTKSPMVRMNSTKMPEENRTVAEDILMEEEDDDEDDKDEDDEEDMENVAQVTKEADD